MEKLFFDLEEKRWVLNSEPSKANILDIQKVEAFLEIFKSTDYFFFIISSTGQNRTACSNGVQGILGYFPNEVTLTFLLQKIHPDESQIVHHFLSVMHKFYTSSKGNDKAKYKTNFTCRVQSAHGRYKQVMFQFIPVPLDYEAEELFMLVCNDINELKTDLEHSLSFIHLYGGKSFQKISSTLTLTQSAPLSKRERQIISLLRKGNGVHDIANNLFISEATVRNHVKRIKNKTGVRSTLQLINSPHLF
ncbi:MAG: helix-turn-helix transcriptional regulator [Flavobacteriales bacterium]|nr:helix-turn-helix transcriptional regulator [Flavobacteriales bacterium]